MENCSHVHSAGHTVPILHSMSSVPWGINVDRVPTVSFLDNQTFAGGSRQQLGKLIEK